MRCAVVGAGAWGTALADLLRRNGHDVALWAFEPDVAESITSRRENVRFLKGQELAAGIAASCELSRVVDGAELVVFATPSTVLRRVASDAARDYAAGVPAIVATKGIEQESCALMTDVVAAVIPRASVVALSGPSFASEVVRCQPTAVVLASADDTIARASQRAFNSPYFRTYTLRDVIGVELGGALKNVMAVATGVADGLGLGNNARAALITRGLAEMTRLGTSLGAEASTFAGLAGLGDLVLTCTGSLSRNREVGLEVGKGRPLADVLRERETVAEGVVAARSALMLAKKQGVTMPIVEAVNRVLFDGQHPREAMGELMTRELRGEAD
ncbi:MAG: NAD(P)-dependent glycerol-3-phosphate dehydrogenase [Gemmatimonadota bacterium]|nr:NAD(P)-dependent glycerol-3-phosphate dehydrogenase [Gemmatimonadota bacterium]